MIFDMQKTKLIKKAISSTHIDDIYPFQAFERAFKEEYDEELNILYLELVYLNSNIFLLERILRFPFQLFSGRKTNTFWELITKSLFNDCVLHLNKIVIDGNNKGNSVGLRELKKKVLTNLVEKYKRSFLKKLKEMRFEKNFEDFKELFKKLRDKHVAHLDRNWLERNTVGRFAEYSVDLESLKKACELVNQLFRTICIGEDRCLIMTEYHIEKYTDIDKVLDLIAKDSRLLNMPEREQAEWLFEKERLSSGEMEFLNKFRANYNLPRV